MIYMDNAATTRLSGKALEAMMPYLTEQYANPAGTYSFTHASNAAMEKARKQVADVIGATSAEIFFTSGGTESDNWALKGTMRANEKKGRHLIISAIEHHAILHSAKALEREGFEVTVLPVDADGVVAPEAVEAAIRPDTVLVSIMAANNEIGTIEPLEAIGAVCKRHGVIFHTDAVQAFGHIPLNVEQMHIDLLSVSAHKFHGPKGVGFLYIRKGVKLVPFMDGGAQEKNRRAGTSNVPGIVGMGEAAQLAAENMETAMAKVAAVRDHLIARIEAEIPYAKLNGQPPAGQCQLLLPLHRGREHADAARCAGRLRVQRLGLHQRLAGSVARAAGHRLPARDRARFAAPVPQRGDDDGGRGFRRRSAQGDHPAPAEHVPALRGFYREEVSSEE